MSWKEFEIQAPKVHYLHHDGRYALHSAVGRKEGEPPTATVPLWRVSMASLRWYPQAWQRAASKMVKTSPWMAARELCR